MTFSKLYAAILVVSIAMATSQVYSQEAKPTAQPQVSETTKLRAANAALKKSLLESQAVQIQESVKAAMAKIQADYKATDEKLQAAIADAYKEANVDKAKFDFDPVDGTFTAKPEPKKDSPVAPAKQ